MSRLEANQEIQAEISNLCFAFLFKFMGAKIPPFLKNAKDLTEEDINAMRELK